MPIRASLENGGRPMAKGFLAEIKENVELENFAGSSVRSSKESQKGPEEILSDYSQLSDLSSTSGLEP
jgi:hypothetical protein